MLCMYSHAKLVFSIYILIENYYTLDYGALKIAYRNWNYKRAEPYKSKPYRVHEMLFSKISNGYTILDHCSRL